MSEAAPTATVITAAYNRSNILRYAIESVLRQSFQDWEYIIVGDHCTDDSEAVANSFDDPRITFINLPENSGGQSGPHNHAVPLARGRYILFLNQDDIYFPRHMEESIAALEETGADIVWSPVVLPQPGSRTSEDWRDQEILLDALPVAGGFHPGSFIISSCWALRREAALRVGPWKSGEEIAYSPSQEFLHRAWKRGFSIRHNPRVSVLCIYASTRPKSYATRDDIETERFFRLIYEQEDGPLRLLEKAAIREAALRRTELQITPSAIWEAGKDGLRRGLSRLLGKHPLELESRKKHREAGGFVATHRLNVMDTPVLSAGEILWVGNPNANGYLGFGWSRPEGEQRWTDGRTAKVACKLNPDARPKRAIIECRPLADQTVRIRFDGGGEVVQDLSSGAFSLVELPVPEGVESTVLELTVDRLVAPASLGFEDDPRKLGLCVRTIRFD